VTVGLVVNTYERTYREVLRPGFFPSIEAANLRPMDEVVALVNNVLDQDDARGRAEALVQAGEISAYAFVADHIDVAVQRSGLSRRDLRRRPYLLDYGLVMPHVTSTRWLLGWDAETCLSEPRNWVDPAISFLLTHPEVFHVSLNWSPPSAAVAGLEAEAVRQVDDYVYNYGFSDQVFLLEREELLGARMRNFAPAALVRHAPHPYTFEYRLESYQRAAGRFRATLSSLGYDTNHIPGGVLGHTGGSRVDAARIRILWQLGWSVLDRLPDRAGPRFKRFPGTGALQQTHPHRGNTVNRRPSS
jgi:hypothetical protein